jgi:hypothetical protein
MLNLIIERGRVWSVAAKSIYLDGAHQGPVIDAEREAYSFDHHANCIRHVTTATCQQVLDALLLGLDPSGFNVFINDIDGDTVLSYWLLANPEQATDSFVRQLVNEVALLDAHGPAYPGLDLASQFHDFVMKPEKHLRRSREYATCNLLALLEECLGLLITFVGTKGHSAGESGPDERTFEVTHTGDNFVMAHSSNFVFDLLYGEGFTRAVAYMQMKDGSFAYTIGKKSEFVANFPVRQILDRLNEIEPGWGGGSTIGGAPRNKDGSRSRLSPDRVFGLIQEFLRGE